MIVKTSRLTIVVLSLYLTVLLSIQICTAVDTIGTSKCLQDGQTIVSSAGAFELGFFSSGYPPKRYIGIWYVKSPSTVVWIANRVKPLTDSSGVLKVTSQGGLILQNSSGDQVWSSNSSRTVVSPVAQLLDSGNFVVRDAQASDLNNFIWQSFDHPSDTLLPGMKLGINRMTGLSRNLMSPKSVYDPSPGDYLYQLDPNGFPQLMIRQGSVVKFRSGPWNGIRFSGTPNLGPNPYYKFGFVMNDQEMYYHYELLDSSITTRLILNSNGNMQRFTWNQRTQSWNLYLAAPVDNCEAYALCGDYGSCNINNSPACSCLKGFVPKNLAEWNAVDWSSGCVRRTALQCGSDIFLEYSGIKLPDTRISQYNQTMNLQECKEVCKRNCSCMGYATLNIKDGTGCLLWYGDLIDIRVFNENGQSIFIRMAGSESGLTKSKLKKEKLVLGSVLPFVVLSLCVGLSIYILKKHRKDKEIKSRGAVKSADNQQEDLELPLFGLAKVATATNDFCLENKLGEGGFGPVYKGRLSNGQEIAVKRLKKNSTQGYDEFKNEVLHVAKLQHRNLVKLIGFCIGEENLLIYEYMPNKGLDSFIFDQTQRKLLNWGRRFRIINGIARGLLYLHQDSRLRIIHRDLKPSNVLLDNEMNPKISDFGLSRSVTENEREANTKRVVGTYGYMSPEYAIDGVFSTKSDVFSYGVLLLEVVSGTRNRAFSHPDHSHNLLGHAWWLYTQEKSIELLDHLIEDSYNKAEVLRSIHVGLLCVQRNPTDRPSMSSVVLMLGSENTLPPPKEPGFFNERKLVQVDTSSSHLERVSGNEISVSLFIGR